MHPEADALLDAIFNHPDDDTPRLVYADWLQEHGYEDYAQFIRLQCAAAHEELWSDEANRLWVEIGRVWNRLDREWMPATRDQWLYLAAKFVSYRRAILELSARRNVLALGIAARVYSAIDTLGSVGKAHYRPATSACRTPCSCEWSRRCGRSVGN